jgi:hypothetical protein
MPHTVPLVLFTVAALFAAIGIRLFRGRRPPDAQRLPLSCWTVGAAMIVIVVVTWGATSWLLSEASTAKDVGAARVEAIKTGLGVGAGTTGIFALLLAVRRQWHSEIDAAEKNVTELYTKAADQIGSGKASVRLAGLYALERLAQDNPRQRQSIVNVICAYLRMPYDRPESIRVPARLWKHRASYSERVQEEEVRLTAQRILTDHLKPSLVEAFWDRINLNLTKAYLIDFSMYKGRLHNSRFGGATFIGDAIFTGATFTGDAIFAGATFTADAIFAGATFARDASVADSANYARSIFTVNGVTYASGMAAFEGVEFVGEVNFDGATSQGRPFASP